MNRKLLAAAVVLGLALLAATFRFASQRPQPTPGREILFLQEEAPTPLSVTKRPLAELQDRLDALSQAALEGSWPQALRLQQQLQELWERLRTQGQGRLDMERRIDELLQTLQQAVLSQDGRGVLQTAQELTGLIGRLGA